MKESPPAAPRLGRGLALALAAALLLVFALRLYDTARRTSLSQDEPEYVGTGLHLWATGDYATYDVLGGHPPLAFHLASLPLAAAGLGGIGAEAGFKAPLLAGRFMDPARLRMLSRLPFVLLGLWAGWLVCAWAWEAAGPAAGLFALYLFSFAPIVLAHVPIAHSDLPVSVFCLQTLYAAWRWLQRRSAGRSLAVGLSLGLALASKLSALLLLPSLGLLLAIDWLRPGALGATVGTAPASGRSGWLRRALRSGGALALWLLCAGSVLWLAYGAELEPVALGPLGVVALPSSGFDESIEHLRALNAGGRQTYFLGEIAQHPAWLALPALWLLKTPLGLIALVLLASLPGRTRAKECSALRVASVGLGVFLCISLFAMHFPMGLRYVLPALMLLPVWIALRLDAAKGWRRRAAWIAGVALAIESLAAHPDYIPHLQPLARLLGPPEHIALDSNLDWGQGLPALADELAGRGNPEVALAYFGDEPPERFGIRARTLGECERSGGWIAISPSVLMGLYSHGNPFVKQRPGCWDWLREHEPVARPGGGAMLLYELPALPANWMRTDAAPAAPRLHPDLLVISLDTTRADALGSYGNAQAQTPNLDALAEQSLRYARAITTAPYTGPAHASLFSGLLPPRHGLRDFLQQSLPESVETLAETLRRADYRTAAFVSAYVLDSRFGLAQGFDLYSAPTAPARRGGFSQRRAGATIDEALAWWSGQSRTEPVFVWIHLFDPHRPYRPPRAFRSQLPKTAPALERVRAAYAGEIRYVDAELGRLFTALAAQDRWRDLLLVVVGDHGEPLGEHGVAPGSHSPLLKDTTLRVPLLIRAPGRLGAGVESRQVRIVDVMPTLLEWLALPAPPGLDGRSLLALDAPRPAYSETLYQDFPALAKLGSELAAISDGTHRLLLGPQGAQLFDLRADPLEEQDLAPQRPEIVARLRAQLEAQRAGAAAPTRRLDLSDEERREHERHLRSLGYLQ